MYDVIYVHLQIPLTIIEQQTTTTCCEHTLRLQTDRHFGENCSLIEELQDSVVAKTSMYVGSRQVVELQSRSATVHSEYLYYESTSQ